MATHNFLSYFMQLVTMNVLYCSCYVCDSYCNVVFIPGFVRIINEKRKLVILVPRFFKVLFPLFIVAKYRQLDNTLQNLETKKQNIRNFEYSDYYFTKFLVQKKSLFFVVNYLLSRYINIK